MAVVQAKASAQARRIWPSAALRPCQILAVFSDVNCDDHLFTVPNPKQNEEACLPIDRKETSWDASRARQFSSLVEAAE